MSKPTNEVYYRYKKKAYINLALHLNKNTESDIIEKLETVPNKNGYIKTLIRDDIAKET